MHKFPITADPPSFLPETFFRELKEVIDMNLLSDRLEVAERLLDSLNDLREGERYKGVAAAIVLIASYSDFYDEFTWRAWNAYENPEFVKGFYRVLSACGWLDLQMVGEGILPLCAYEDDKGRCICAGDVLRDGRFWCAYHK